MAIKKNPRHEHRAMPGERVSRPADMANYLVALKEEDENDASALPPSRAAIYDAGLAHTARFQHTLRQFLTAKRVADQVAAIGEPSGLPVVTLTCTPAVAKLIESLPEVDAVVRDSPDLEMIRQ